MCIGGEMIICSAIAFGFPMKIPVFNVKTDGQPHVGIGGQLFAARAFGCRSGKMKHRGIFPFGHFGAQLDFDRPPVAGMGDKLPDGGRPGGKRREIFRVER